MQKRMRIDTVLWLMIFTLSFFVCVPATLAEVSVGDTIDKSNWQNIEQMVPDPVLAWVKKGDFVLNIDELKFDPTEFYPKPTKEIMESNQGRYALNDKGVIVDAATGKVVFVEGIPFPKIDLNDPQAALKILHTSQYSRHVGGDLQFRPVGFYWCSRTGVDRSIKMDYLSSLYTGAPYVKDRPNPDGFERKNIFVAIHPFDIAGTAVMLWRYLDDRRDNNYSYVPAIRRVRRMTPASRSDAFMGSDFCMDDTAGYDGKVTDFNWKIIGTVDGLQPWFTMEPQEMTKLPGNNGYASTKNMKKVQYGYEVDGWQGAAWAPMNIKWVKRKMIIMEGTPKDPYYNYGKTILWLDAERYVPPYKVIYDRAGKYWKTAVNILGTVASDDGFFKDCIWNLLMIDDRNDHATLIIQFAPDVQVSWYRKDINPDDFSLAGFQKYCK